ncbi:MAG: hypothetical protein RML46_00465 [Anaerolineae bacterium]|nr:hypothetical protein [Anaerolineae bacterium]MDW8067367.1 hypothetical protein [Anaerolineae bacterium]
MIWLTFFISAVVVVLAAIKLAEYGDAIGYRTGLGSMFIGTLLVASATSLPELLTAINSIRQDVIDLAAGGMLGSNMFNMCLLGVLSLLFFRQRVLRRVAMKHALSGSVAVFVNGLTTFFILARLGLRIGWVGLDSLLVAGTGVAGMWLIWANVPGTPGAVPAPASEEEGIPSLRRALIGFSLAVVVLVLASPHLVRSSAAIADATGLSTGFIGTLALATITSLPELVTIIAAARLGAHDLAVGNLFGSNIFNMFALGLTDLFYTRGTLFSAISPDLALVGLLGLLLTGIGLIGNQARLDRLVWVVELDGILLVVGYVVGLGFLYIRGIGL